MSAIKPGRYLVGPTSDFIGGNIEFLESCCSNIYPTVWTTMAGHKFYIMKRQFGTVDVLEPHTPGTYDYDLVGSFEVTTRTFCLVNVLEYPNRLVPYSGRDSLIARYGTGCYHSCALGVSRYIKPYNGVVRESHLVDVTGDTFLVPNRGNLVFGDIYIESFPIE